ncbi:uncharacterized protein A1O5_12465 [Cladophialophora psammophila CBS 110553]|uniref:Uncharacterized protein n=1 Tax=Cladophialophora psammophila CBS 110553 TaxID=1182543 RepID=W9VY74_9EURO|nr:uncharacterized protein A1O5_12465 [Cladophialophora psammophila CBS 110553]EXJ57675.1 hypothetical protein A1O5_12465 [Cladophialophora psammophila CBS 110553]
MGDTVVEEIRQAGRVAVPDYHILTQGGKIIETAVDVFGTVHILVNNAAFFQMYGRIVCTSSGAGIYGSFGQSNYSGIIEFVNAIAKEEARYNIKANTLTPAAASRLTMTVMAPELLTRLSPEWVAPVVAALTHESSHKTGAVFDVGAGCVMKFQWEWAAGLDIERDQPPAYILHNFDRVTDFSDPRIWGMDLLKGKVAIVAAAVGGLGSEYTLTLATLDASVVVNDVCAVAADAVVEKIKTVGGAAVSCTYTVENARQTVQKAIEGFGGVHILVVVSGNVLERPLDEIANNEWSQAYDSQAKSAYPITKALWPIFLKQSMVELWCLLQNWGYQVGLDLLVSALEHRLLLGLRELSSEKVKSTGSVSTPSHRCQQIHHHDSKQKEGVSPKI